MRLSKGSSAVEMQRGRPRSLATFFSRSWALLRAFSRARIGLSSNHTIRASSGNWGRGRARAGWIACFQHYSGKFQAARDASGHGAAGPGAVRYGNEHYCRAADSRHDAPAAEGPRCHPGVPRPAIAICPHCSTTGNIIIVAAAAPPSRSPQRRAPLRPQSSPARP